MRKIILFFVLFLLVLAINVSAYNIFIDEGLDDTKIKEFVLQKDLDMVNKVVFLRLNHYNNGWFQPFGYWNQIFIYNMPRDDWRITFMHEVGHNYCWNNFRDLTEECAEKFRVYKE